MNTSKHTPSASGWKRKFFVYGHIAKGVVYALIGGLAVAAVIQGAQNPQGMKDVIRWLQDQPFGQILLVLMAVGLLSYCAWRWIKAIDDPGNEGSDAKGIAKRTAYAASGTVYGVLSVFTISLLTSGGGGGGGTSKQDMLGQILSEPWGQWIVGIIGLVIIGTGVYQLIRGLKEKYMEDLRTNRMDHKEEEAYRNFGKAGHIARAVVYGIIGYFIIRVAMSNNPGQFRGLEGALEYLGGQAFGTILLGIVALGLMLYGAFMFAKAKYHRVA